MHLTLRPYATAGVALTAAGVIALAPVAPQPPAIQISAPRIGSAAVQLAAVDLTTVYGDLITNTINSLVGDLSTSPPGSADSLVGLLFPGILPLGQATPEFLPIIQQLFRNLGAYFAAVVNDPIAEFQFVLTNTSVPALSQALTELLAGNLSGALQSLGTAVSAPVIAAVNQFVSGVIAIPTAIGTNLTALITALPTLGQIALTGIVGTPVAVFDGAQQAIQNVLSATDLAGVLTAILAAPGVFLDEVLNANGGTTVGTAQGLLSPNGPIGAVLQIRNGIAAALATALSGPASSTPAAAAATPKTTAASSTPAAATPTTAAASSTPAAAAATPKTAAASVTLSVAPTTAGSAPATSKTTNTTTLNTNVVPNGHKDTAVTPPVRTTTTGTSGTNASPTITPDTHLTTTLKTVTAPPNTTKKTVADLGAAQRGGKANKR